MSKFQISNSQIPKMRWMGYLLKTDTTFAHVWMCATIGARSAFPSGENDIMSVFDGVRVTLSFDFDVVMCFCHLSFVFDSFSIFCYSFVNYRY